MAKKKPHDAKRANRKYAKEAGIDMEVAAQLGQRNGRYNAKKVTEQDQKAREEQEDGM